MRNLLFTGASGFLGKNVLPLLINKYSVTTLGIMDSDNIKSNLAIDIPKINERFNTVFHAAGKAHIVPRTKKEEEDFYKINYNGTINLCKALELSGVPKSFIFVSTVAVYGLEYGDMITEDAPLNGNTPYAKSKIMAEKYLEEWCNKNGVVLSIIRPSLISGPNAPGNLGAMVNGIKSRKYLSIGGGLAKKSILQVQDIAVLIELLEDKGGIYNVCDSEQLSFKDLELLISKQLNCKPPISIPLFFAKFIAKIGDCFFGKFPIDTLKLNKITKNLTFSNKKAVKELGWKPMSVRQNYNIY